MGITIKDAPLVEQLSGDEKIPISDGSNEPRTVNVGQIKEFANKGIEIPTKVSELENDSGYATSKEVEDAISKIPTPDVSGQIASALVDYVKKVEGKGLSTNDFTNELKTKLEGITPYDPSELEAEISKLGTALNTLVGGNASNAIESFNEIIAFLDRISDNEDLDSIIASIEQQIASKYSKPLSGIPKSDFSSDVQSSLNKAETALQEEQFKGTVVAVDTDESVDDPNIPSGSYDDTEIKKQIAGLESEVERKQENLISGQNIKTINGKSLLGEGDIEIERGDSYDDTELKNQITDLETDVSKKADEAETASKLSELGSQLVSETLTPVECTILSSVFATASPEILSTGSSTYKVDYIPIQIGTEYHIKASNLSLVDNWIQIGTTTEIPAANVAINKVVRYMDSKDKNVDMVYKSDIDGYLVCFYQGEQGYSFAEKVLSYILPALTEKVEELENTVSSYNDTIYEREDKVIDDVVLDGLFLTATGTTIGQTTDTEYKLAYSRVEKGKKYKVINDNCSYPQGWAVVSFSTKTPAKDTPVKLLEFAEGNISVIDYSYIPSEDGYLCVTYKLTGSKSKIYESQLTSTPTTDVLKGKIANLETIAAKSSLILPPAFFAVVGYEFNIYWDTIYVTPDYGEGCPNYMVQAVCNIGANYQRSFRVTPTASQAGEYEITIQVYGVNGSLIDEKKSILVVINPSAITITRPKNILSLGDSTIDDNGYMIKNLYSSIADLGFNNKILPIGTRGFLGSKHEARSGYTYKEYLTTQKICKIYVSNLSDIVARLNELNVTPHPEFKNPNNNSRIWISDMNVAEGWMTAGNNALSDGWNGTLQSFNTNIINIAAVVTNVENNVDNIVLYKNNSIDFANYMASVYGDATKTINVLTMANGINDCRGALKSQGQIEEIVNNARVIIDAFLSYNPSGKVLIALPKIKASTLIESYPSTYTLNSYNLRRTINEVFSSYDERVIVFGEVCGMDRFWGYPIYENVAAARIPNKVIYNTDAVHPRNEGYLQIADTYLGALLYACKD